MNSIEISLQDVSRILREMREDPIQKYSTPFAEEEICTPYESECDGDESECDGEESEYDGEENEDNYEIKTYIPSYVYIPPSYDLIFQMYRTFMQQNLPF
jgi:hypothetical protein